MATINRKFGYYKVQLSCIVLLVILLWFKNLVNYGCRKPDRSCRNLLRNIQSSDDSFQEKLCYRLMIKMFRTARAARAPIKTGSVGKY